MLAGVNGAGKSSLLGAMLAADGVPWFNPDSFTRRLVGLGWPQGKANEAAWHEGVARLRAAIADDHDFAFETTLGGNTIPALLRQAAACHEVSIWFCGLADVGLHLQRVARRVASGGHDIPEAKIRERFDTSRLNLVDLLPRLARLHVYDNSRPARADGSVEPRLVLEYGRGRVLHPASVEQMRQVPDWARAIVAAALRLVRPDADR